MLVPEPEASGTLSRDTTVASARPLQKRRQDKQARSKEKRYVEETRNKTKKSSKRGLADASSDSIVQHGIKQKLRLSG
jgi:hypothetical protein